MCSQYDIQRLYKKACWLSKQDGTSTVIRLSVCIIGFTEQHRSLFADPRATGLFQKDVYV